MNTKKYPSDWLDTAVSGIRFGPDRNAVRCELMEHIEDKAADLMRIFPDIPEEEARERALAAMGDPEEVKIQLARVHRPWLGWLWTASRWALGILTAAALFLWVTQGEPSNNPVIGGYWGYPHERCGVPDSPRPERAELGGYTFQIVEAAFLDYPEGRASYSDKVCVVLRVSSPKFWERVAPEAVYDALTATLPGGDAYPMDQPVILDVEKAPEAAMEQARWGICFREYYLFFRTGEWPPGGRVTLDFDFPQGSFTLSAGVTERVVMK